MSVETDVPGSPLFNLWIITGDSAGVSGGRDVLLGDYDKLLGGLDRASGGYGKFSGGFVSGCLNYTALKEGAKSFARVRMGNARVRGHFARVQAGYARV